MAGLATILEALGAYWSSPPVLVVVSVVAASLATLAYVFLSNARNTRLRVSLLTGMYALTIFFWLFVAVSLVLCVSQAGMVAYRRNGVSVAAAAAVFTAYTATALLSWIVWRRAPRSVLRRFAPRAPRADERWLQDSVDLRARFEGVAPVRLGIVDRTEPLAMAVAGKEAHVLVSRGLLDALDREEVEAVAAHELMHLKHHDAEFKVVSTILSRVLFFDPFSKVFDPAVHREREYLADEMSGRSTGRPAALASALLKIAEGGAPPRAAWGISILGPRRGLFSRYPPLRERVNRLLLLSKLLSKNGNGPAGA